MITIALIFFTLFGVQKELGWRMMGTLILLDSVQPNISNIPQFNCIN